MLLGLHRDVVATSFSYRARLGGRRDRGESIQQIS